MKPLHPSIRTVWTLSYALYVLLLLIVTGVYDLTALVRGHGFLPAGLASVSVLILGTLYTLLVPRLRYRVWRYELAPEELRLEQGVLVRLWTTVPLRRIQHLDVSQNLLEREFDLAKLIIHTAGARSSEVILPGLHRPDAERLRDELKHYVLEDAV